MAQEIMNIVDRDCQVAAILAASWGSDAMSAQGMVNRFKETLEVIRSAGGTYQIWVDTDPKKKG